MKLLKIFTLCAAGLLSATSCDLKEEPFTFIAGETLAEEGDVNELVAGAYLPLNWMFEWGNYDTVVNFDCDYQTGPTWAFSDEGAGNFYDKASTNVFYKNLCICVHRANYHASLVRKASNVSSAERDNALGELLFLKAWCQFQLVQHYGPIPLFTYSIGEGNDINLPRSPVKDVYAHIIETLKEAEGLLYAYTDASHVKGHVFRASASGLLAKVYATIASAAMPTGANITVKGGPGLRYNPDGTTTRAMPVAITHQKDQVAGYEDFDYLEYYRLAKEKAKEVIESGEVRLAPSQENLWSPSSKNISEFLFCLQTQAGKGTEYSNYMTKSWYGYPDPTEDDTWSQGYYVQRDHWLQTFDDWEDERICWGVLHRVPYVHYDGYPTYWYFHPERDSVKVKNGEPPYPGCPYHYEPGDEVRNGAHEYGAKLTKFLAITAPNDGNRTDYNWPFLRYADVVLIYCEADNELNGPTPDAFRVMEMLNTRNNSTPCSKRNARTPFTKDSFRSFILEERAKEFAAEGHRRTDLIRWGIYLQVMNAIGDYDENDNLKRREPKHLLLPFPLDVINTNPLIDRNNPGW